MKNTENATIPMSGRRYVVFNPRRLSGNWSKQLRNEARRASSTRTRVKNRTSRSLGIPTLRLEHVPAQTVAFWPHLAQTISAQTRVNRIENCWAVIDHEVQNGVVASIAGAPPPDRREQASNGRPAQCSWWQFSSIDPRRIDDVQTAGRFAMVPAITQERPQVRDNMLKRPAVVLLALDLDEGFDVRGGQPRKTAIGRQSTGQKVGHGCPVLLERLLRKTAHLGKVVVIAATQQAQRVSALNGNQASCGGQEAGEDTARAEILVGTWAGNNERLPEILFLEHPSGLKSITSVEHLPDPVQMQPKWMSQMASRRQPIGERFQFGPKTRSFVPSMVPGKQILQHGDPSR